MQGEVAFVPGHDVVGELRVCREADGIEAEFRARFQRVRYQDEEGTGGEHREKDEGDVLRCGSELGALLHQISHPRRRMRTKKPRMKLANIAMLTPCAAA